MCVSSAEIQCIPISIIYSPDDAVRILGLFIVTWFIYGFSE